MTASVVDFKNPDLLSYGIDPGWVNLGFALVRPSSEPLKVEVLQSKTLNPSLHAYPEDFVLKELFPDSPFSRSSSPAAASSLFLTLERYVPYAGVQTAESENITMLIGMLRMYASCTSSSSGATIYASMLRAIEWKVQYAQMLSKFSQGFENPSTNLDKGFSIAVAKHITTNPDCFATDHEADAICLAALPLLTGQVRQQLGLSGIVSRPGKPTGPRPAKARGAKRAG